MISLTCMRRFDTWLGWPVATLLGLWPRRRRALPMAPRQIVIVKLSGLGSLLVCAGVFRALRASQPQARLVVVALEGTAAAARLIPEVDEVLAVSACGAGPLLRDGLRVLCDLRRRRVDVIADIEYFSKLSTVFCALAGARYRLGFRLPAYWRQRLIDGGIAFREDIHFRACVARLLQPLGVDYRQLPDGLVTPTAAAEQAAEALLAQEAGMVLLSAPTTFRYDVDEPRNARSLGVAELRPPKCVIEERSTITTQGRSSETPSEQMGLRRGLETAAAPIWAVVNPHATALCVQRRWPLERFAQVADSLLQTHPELRIVIPGTAEERNRSEQLRELFPAARRDRVCVLAGHTDLGMLAVILLRSHLVLTGDTGVMHLAAAVGAPLVALFGPESPVRYGPVGGGNAPQNGRITNHAKKCVILTGDVPCGPCLSYMNHKRAPCEAEPSACLLAISVEEVRRACEDVLQQAYVCGPVAHLRRGEVTHIEACEPSRIAYRYERGSIGRATWVSIWAGVQRAGVGA